MLQCLQDAVRWSALRAACSQGCIDVARVLLEHGAAVDYQDNVIGYSNFLYYYNNYYVQPLFYRKGDWLLSLHANEVMLKL